jgi:hypothetical protein
VVEADVTRNHRDETVEELLDRDIRVQHEFEQLSRLLKEIVDIPLNETPVTSDPSWPIPERHVSRWLITLEGEIRSDRVTAFRGTLLKCDNVIDVHVSDLLDGHICIRVVTTGGIHMGPLQRAITELRTPSGNASPFIVEPFFPRLSA